MNIVIIGWYGTETLGDRAILDGLLNVFNTDGNLNVYLGSLYPFLSCRSVFEDDYPKTNPGINIKIFNLYDRKQLKRAISDSSFVLMGGGPLMDLDELFLIISAFELAKRKRIRTGLIGCGYGPIREAIYKKAVIKLISLSDVVILRDKNSVIEINSFLPNRKLYYCEDPAIISVLLFMERNVGLAKRESDYIVVNLRDYPQQAYGSDASLSDTFLSQLCEYIRKEKEVILLPMHTFVIGGDDRFFLDFVKRKYSLDNATVVSKPLSLFDTYRTIESAKYCIGMRYHSIVMQTLLNGNNYIIDYTDKKNGKISSFLNDVDRFGFFKERTVNLHNNSNLFFKFDSSKFVCSLSSDTIIRDYRDILGIADKL